MKSEQGFKFKPKMRKTYPSRRDQSISYQKGKHQQYNGNELFTHDTKDLKWFRKQSGSFYW